MTSIEAQIFTIIVAKNVNVKLNIKKEMSIFILSKYSIDYFYINTQILICLQIHYSLL